MEVLSSKGLVWRSPLKTNRRELGENETEQIGPENIFTTKSQGKPNSSTASSTLERQYDREISFHQLPEGDVPLYQEAERVQCDGWVTHGSVKIHSPVEATKMRQQVPCERRLHSRFAYRIKKVFYWILPVTPARESDSTIGHSGSALPGQCPWFGENRCPDSALDSRKRVPSTCVINGMVSES